MQRPELRISIVRGFISLLLTFLFLGAFLSPESIGTWSLFDGYLYLQVIPSLLKLLSGSFWLAGSGVLLILLFTGLFGRFYCSFICPLGFIQDFIIWISRYRTRKNRYSIGYRKIRYLVFALFLIFVCTGSPVLIQFLDPYSLAGKTVHALVIPLEEITKTVLLYGADLSLTGFMEYEKHIQYSPGLYIYVSIFIVILAFFSMRCGRLYCNTFCPVGVFLGFLSHRSLYGFVLNREACTGCRKCEKVCSSQCIDSGNHRIDLERCVSCFECRDVCPESAITYKNTRISEPDSPYKAKRFFLMTTVTSLVSFVFLNGKASQLTPEDNRISKGCVIPPGALNINRYAANCTGCNLCVEACYSKVLNPVYKRHGLKGVFIPLLDFSRGKCAYDCHECSKICPTHAILPVSLIQKKQIQIGQVNLIKDKCIVYKLKKDCGACAEVCPTHAVYTDKREGLRYPETVPKSCVGCGACEHVCPVKPKAILVSGNSVHLTAEKPFYPETKETENIFKPDDEFPF